MTLELFQDELREFKRALQDEAGIFARGFSDASRVSDFCLHDYEIVGIGERLGVRIDDSDSLLDVLKRLPARKVN